MNSTYSSWSLLNSFLTGNAWSYTKKATITFVLSVAVIIFLVRLWRMCCASKEREPHHKLAKKETGKIKENLGTNQRRRIPSVTPSHTSLSNQPHSWQNTGIRRRVFSTQKNAAATSPHFRADETAGIPIGYYAVGEGESLENEIVGLYEDQ